DGATGAERATLVGPDLRKDFCLLPMLLIRIFSAAILVLLITSPGLKAEEVKWAARPIIRKLTGDLTLDEAVKTALRQNPDVLKQLQEIERTRGQVIEVRAEALPHLSATG